jgi:AcrR family transcriptional regulator
MVVGEQQGAPVDRRVRKTQRALREAFIALVLERGYAAVTVEDVTDRADVARATYYKHFADKEELLTTLFEEMTSDVSARLALVEGAPSTIRTWGDRLLYEHALQFRDLYLVCLRGAGNGRARAAYLDVIAGATESIFAERLRASGKEPLVPLPMLSRAFAGAVVALIEQWLELEPRPDVETRIYLQKKLLTNGFAWALGMLPDGFPVDLFPRLDSELGEGADRRSITEDA